MQSNHKSQYFLLFCLAASLVIVYFILEPFLPPLILAGVFAFIFQPLYRFFLRLTHRHEALSALAVTVTAIILVVLPMTYLGTLVLKESSQLYQAFTGGDDGGLVVMVQSLVKNARVYFHIPANFDINLSQYARQALETLVQNIGVIFSSFAKMLLNVFVFLAAFYFLLKDGLKLKDYFVELSPLEDKDDELIVSRLKSAVSATVKGSLTIGLIQGALAGVGFAFFGVPNAVLWGCLAAIMSLVPGVGTAIVLVPATAFLFVTGSTYSGVGLAVWGLLAVGLIDNFLGPRLVGHGMQLHPFAVFLAVLGGLAFFGPLGFLFGPLAMSMCLALIEIYFSIRDNNKVVLKNTVPRRKIKSARVKI